MVWCNNLTDIYLKLYELDFGTGNPSLALPPELNDIVQIQCSRPVEEGAPAGRACARSTALLYMCPAY